MPSQAASRRSSSHQTASTSQHAIGDDSSAVVASLADDPKYAIATAFLSTMLHEVVIDTALLVHAQVKRQQRAEGKAPGGCPVCKTSCQKPADDKKNQEKAIKTEAGEEGEVSEAATITPKGLEMYQNNPLLACLVCSRQVSANRYAQHLASCVGVGKGGIARRKGKNGLAGLSSAKDRSKIKTALENRKKANFQTQSNRNTPTPTTRLEQESASGASDEESGSRKTKTLADTLGLNANGKRTLSPSRDSAKRAKHNAMSRTDSRNSAFAPSSLGSSLPVTGSPLNPHRSTSKVASVIDDDDDAEDEEEGEDDDDAGEEDDDEEDEDDDDDDASLALAGGINRQARNDSVASFDDSDDARSEPISDTASFVSKKKQSDNKSQIVSTIERSKGSDGEYIDVESASAHSEVDDDF